METAYTWSPRVLNHADLIQSLGPAVSSSRALSPKYKVLVSVIVLSWGHDMSVYMLGGKFTCICTYVSVYVCISVYISIYLCTFVRMYVRTYE